MAVNKMEPLQRAVAYCRVSSDHDDQLNSLANQKQHWQEYIRNNPDMEFCGLYVDEGITGTSTLKRDGFNRMMEDARQKKFDLILTKEVSRFARNTVDTLVYTRKLKELGIGVYFQNDNIFSLDRDGELRLTIMATLAQEESRKTSERVKWGHKRAMKNGVVFGADRILGYDLVNKRLTVNEDEAVIVRKVFDWFLAGESMHGIVRRLKELGYERGKMNGKLNHTSIRRILQNEKYCGILKQRKYFTADFLTHKQQKNTGDKPFIIIEDNHPAIVSREQWSAVQEKLAENKRKYDQYRIGYSRHVWGGKIVCGCCGARYRRRTLKNKDGSRRPVWMCTTAYNHGKKGCGNSSYLREEVLENAFMDVFGRLKNDKTKKAFVEEVITVLSGTLTEANHLKNLKEIKTQLANIEKQKGKLLDLYLNDKMDTERYQKKNDELTSVENNLKHSLTTAANSTRIIADKKKRLAKLYEQLVNRSDGNEFRSGLVEEYLEEVVASEGQLVIRLVAREFRVDLNRYPKRFNHGDYPPGGSLERQRPCSQQTGHS